MFLEERHYKQAEKNGISRELADERFYDMGWSIQTAITLSSKAGTDKSFKEYRDRKRAEGVRNGIPASTFNTRVHKGWSEERAATAPVRKMDPERKKWQDIAEKNGIDKQLFRVRLQLGWGMEKAATLPKQRRGRMSKQSKYESMGYNVSWYTYRERIRKGWTIEEATNIPENNRRVLCE